MFEFLQQIATGFALLPSYLIVISIALVILPTIAAVLLRYSLYRHLQFLSTRVRRLLGGARQGEQPRIIENLEQRFQQASSQIEQVNTAALIEGIYSREQFSFLGFSLRCEPIDYFCRILPNLLLSFGLLGTFLGITINLANISQTISQVEISDVRSLVQELNQPLQGMGIAFITSLIAVACSSLLTVVNFSWNTSLAKSAIINSLEDYLDNIYLPQLPARNPIGESIDRLVTEFDNFLSKFEGTVGQAIGQSVALPIQQMVAENQKISKFAEQVYSGLIESSGSLEKSATSFRQAANTIEQSKFAEKLSSATTDLSIAQNQFSQSSLVLKKSTQSIENTLGTVQSSVQKMLDIGEEISELNKKYATMLALNQKQSALEEDDLNGIKSELNNLVDKLREI